MVRRQPANVALRLAWNFGRVLTDPKRYVQGQTVIVKKQ